ncbi:radical SAM protein [Candidatus Woesearchaeota archaeon]|nr:MAG: tungsten-containing aldehyde ferredoxin oxidoreductase cofactor modifying protein [archaeon GW2011_AR4]MBS3129526.1 radical SAM protein [Candidatus Woesearchaeota archaeon]HIH37494.1 radical SAM protein [Candidatus Woesearchaeota archaeon]HIH49595.1 radical SAM protein [Candidatus Woesearchaeota archaeon]HIJ03251.1 radical SAM protein [Candidatus Woesearchaeota archaeon]
MRPAIVQGWDIPKEEYLATHKDNRLIKLLIDLSNGCNLWCHGCFTMRSTSVKRRLTNEMGADDQLRLLDEAAALGVRTVDIVGAGEPTLDPDYGRIISHIKDLGMRPVVFTHGATGHFERESAYEGSVSYFIKLWSLDSEEQNRYVSEPGKSLGFDYASWRNRTLENLTNKWLTQGEEVMLDGISYVTTCVGADVLVRKSNMDEIVSIHEVCRKLGVMPLIKSYIPEGPTLFDQEQNRGLVTLEMLSELQTDEATPADMMRVRQQLIALDRELGIPDMETFYPQGCKCTQSMASLYVDILGNVRSCVGTQPIPIGTYEPGKGILLHALMERAHAVGFGCPPRLEDAKRRGLEIDDGMRRLYGEGMRRQA